MPATSATSPLRATRTSVFLPKEHGSWSLALEPLALGLIAAPSVAGGALALATVAAFFARRPLKALLASDGATPRPGALPAFVLLAACSAAGLATVAALGGIAPLWPLLLAAPCGVLFLHFDWQGESRAAAAELAGGTAFALLPAALATLAGWHAPAALGLAAIMVARTLPTILTVRTCLRLNKRQPAAPFRPIAAAAGALIGIGALAAFALVPWIAVAGAFLLLARTGLLVSPARPAWSARRIGFSEAVIGLLYVTAIGLASRP